jgi:hypothetical protein
VRSHSGLDVNVVQARLRDASATPTLNVYDHFWSGSDDWVRAAIAAVLNARADVLRTAAIGRALTWVSPYRSKYMANS